MSVFFGLSQACVVACTSEANSGSVDFWSVVSPCGETAWNEQACKTLEHSSVFIENHASSVDFLSFVGHLCGESKPLKNANPVGRTKLKKASHLGKKDSKCHGFSVV